MKILVAEDEEVILKTYELALASRGHKVFATPDGEKCLRTFDEYLSKTKPSAPFDLVILDYRMPGKDGLEVAQEIRAKTPSQRIIIASAYTHELKIPPSLQTLEFVQKPFGIDMLFDLVERTSSGTSKFRQSQSLSNNTYKGEANIHSDAIHRDSEKVDFDRGYAFWFQS